MTDSDNDKEYEVEYVNEDYEDLLKETAEYDYIDSNDTDHEQDTNFVIEISSNSNDIDSEQEATNSINRVRRRLRRWNRRRIKKSRRTFQRQFDKLEGIAEDNLGINDGDQLKTNANNDTVTEVQPVGIVSIGSVQIVNSDTSSAYQNGYDIDLHNGYNINNNDYIITIAPIWLIVIIGLILAVLVINIYYILIYFKCCKKKKDYDPLDIESMDESI